MPELRKDPILSRWVIIATERAKRPEDFKPAVSSSVETECPFCRGKEHLTSPEIFSIKNDRGEWQTRVFSSQQPFVEPTARFWKKGKGPYDLMGGVGNHEVIVESPEHIASLGDLEETQIKDVFFTYQSRVKEIEKNEQIKYVLIFKNYGWEAGGGRIRHSRSQLIATPVNLKRVKEELEGAKAHYRYHERCIFCDMIDQELGFEERVILDEGGFVALAPFAPRFPFEVWILPRRHSADFYKTNEGDLYNLGRIIKKVLTKIKTLLKDPPYNYVIHTAPFRRSNPGYWSTLEEDFHWHIEITPILTRVAGFEWGTGFYICPTLPEAAAKFLREA